MADAIGPGGQCAPLTPTRPLNSRSIARLSCSNPPLYDHDVQKPTTTSRASALIAANVSRGDVSRVASAYVDATSATATARNPTRTTRASASLGGDIVVVMASMSDGSSEPFDAR